MNALLEKYPELEEYMDRIPFCEKGFTGVVGEYWSIHNRPTDGAYHWIKSLDIWTHQYGPDVEQSSINEVIARVRSLGEDSPESQMFNEIIKFWEDTTQKKLKS